MKKRLLAVALAGVALVGCVKNEDGTLVKQEGVKIAFDTPLTYDNSTRANVYGEIGEYAYTGTTGKYTYPRTEDFVVFGVKYDGTFAGWANSTNVEPVLFNGKTVSYDPKVDGWAPKQGENNEGYYYWPDGKNVAFAAYSPAGLEQAADWDPATKVSYGEKGLKIADFVIPENPEKHFDLMFSQRVVDQNIDDMLHGAEYYSGIPLKFQHALSSIRFSILNDSNGADVILKNITISGVKNVGTFVENIKDEDGYDRAEGGNVAPYWNVTGVSKEGLTYTAYDKGTSVGVTFPYEAQMLAAYAANDGIDGDICHTLLFMPQQLSDDVVAKISYEIAGVPQSKTVKLNLGKTINSTKDNPEEIRVNEWEMGYRYIYRLHYSADSADKDKVYFSPSSDVWKDAQVVVIEL